jgi:hypothetical protein
MTLRSAALIALAMAAVSALSALVILNFTPEAALEAPPPTVTLGDEDSPLALTFSYRRPDGTMHEQKLRYHNGDTGTALFNEQSKEVSMTVLYPDGVLRGYYLFGEHGTEEGEMRRDDRSIAWRSEKVSADEVRTYTWWVGGTQLFSDVTVNFKTNIVKSLFYRRDGTLWIDKVGPKYYGHIIEKVYGEDGVIDYLIETDGNVKNITLYDVGVRKFTQVWTTTHFSSGPISYSKTRLSRVMVFDAAGEQVAYTLTTNLQDEKPSFDMMQVEHPDGSSTKSLIEGGEITLVMELDDFDIVTERREIPENEQVPFSFDPRYLAAQPEAVDPLPSWREAEPDPLSVIRRET